MNLILNKFNFIFLIMFTILTIFHITRRSNVITKIDIVAFIIIKASIF